MCLAIRRLNYSFGAHQYSNLIVAKAGRAKVPNHLFRLLSVAENTDCYGSLIVIICHDLAPFRAKVASTRGDT
jgi:hypothetical protein